jgi:O-antigen ligase
LYYALVNSPKAARQLFGLGLGVLDALLAVYFASQHDWTAGPAKFAIIGTLGRLLNRHVPQLGLYQPNGNVVANLMALALPVSLVLAIDGLRNWREASVRQRLLALGAALSALVTVFGLGMSESRASAIALVGAAGMAPWWWLASRLGRPGRRTGLVIFAGGVALVVLAGVAVALAAPGLLTTALGTLPGPNSTISRAQLFAQVWHLAQDTPFTGGGLGAFPGLYSTYILDVPNLYLTHAHNAYLNVLVEQGWPGFLSFIAVLAAAVAAGMQPLRRGQAGGDPLTAAGLLALAVLLVQALGDGTLVASRLALAWLIPAGLAAGGWPEAGQPVAEAAAPKPADFRFRAMLLGGATVALICAAALTWPRWLAAWHSDVGSVSFARIQLVGWPTNHWSDGHEASQLAAVTPEFDRALALDPDNVTALYRLGILASLQRDFPAAVQNLALAHRADPAHMGVLKALAYAYIWNGDTQDARPLLNAVPEAKNEMTVYAWWWGTQNRPDLAGRANQAAAQLAAGP